MSLYRKYRPQSFAEVVGQDPVVTTLEQAAKQDKLSHAFLFAGSRGTGKTSVARILAKILMIRDIEDEVVQKQIIKGVEEGSIVDLLEIDAASNRGIDDVRDLIEKIQFSPVVASAKVYIIDEVHMLTKEAFNALLKTLEEPPAYAYFILATTELNKIPVTIQSRCQCFPFRAIHEEDIIRRLQYIADQEHIKVEREALRAIAHHVQGSMRDAISMLDQMRALEKITLEDIEERMGKTGSEFTEPLFEAIDTENTEEIISIVQKIEEAGIPLDVFLRMLLGQVRSMLHRAIEEKKPIAPLHTILDTLLKAIRDVRIAPVPGLVLESALLSLLHTTEGETKLMKQSRKEEKDGAKEKVKQGKRDKKEKVRVKQDEVPEEMAQEKEDHKEGEETLKEAAVEAMELSIENLRGIWPDVVNEVSPPSVKMSLKNGELLAVDEKKITVGFSSAFHRDKVQNVEASRKIEEILADHLKRTIRLECVLGDAEKEAITPEPDVDLAEAAAEIF